MEGVRDLLMGGPPTPNIEWSINCPHRSKCNGQEEESESQKKTDRTELECDLVSASTTMKNSRKFGLTGQ